MLVRNWHPHVTVPVLHLHSPHVAWHHVEHPLRAGLVTLGIVMTIAVGATVVRHGPEIIASKKPVLEAALYDVRPGGLASAMRYRGKPVTFDHMYPSSVQAPSVDHMYARPRPRVDR